MLFEGVLVEVVERGRRKKNQRSTRIDQSIANTESVVTE